ELAAVLLADPRAAMAADVVERPVPALAVAQDDDALLADLLREPVTRIGDPVLAADAEPALGENVFQLMAEDFRRCVVFAGQGTGTVDRDLGGLEERSHRQGLQGSIGEICHAAGGRGSGTRRWLTIEEGTCEGH